MMTARPLSEAAIAILLGAASLSACGMGSAAVSSGNDGATAPAANSAPTLNELANATLLGVSDRPVTLVDGRWEGEPFVEGGASRPTVGLVEDFLLTGDLTGDGRDEAVVLVWESTGGSGTRTYLAAMGRRGEEVVNLGTSLVGDRVQVKAGFIAAGLTTLDLVRAGPGEAACCPTQKVLVGWRLEDGNLVRVSTEITGSLSLDDLEGPEWVLEKIGRDDPVADGPPIWIGFDEDRVEGSGGCNAYFGTVTGETPGVLVFSAMGTTMMACSEPAMDLERRFLRTLAGGSRYSFVAGRLVIGCETDDGGVVDLIFRRADPTQSAADGEP